MFLFFNKNHASQTKSLMLKMGRGQYILNNKPFVILLMLSNIWWTKNWVHISCIVFHITVLSGTNNKC